MRERHLFTMAEIATLKEYKGYKPFLPLVWALEEVEKAMKTDYPNAPRGPELATIIATFRGLAFEMRGHCGQITNWLKQPVPFPYFQFLTLLLMVDLTLIAYGLTNMEFHWALTFVIYLVILSSFMGLKEVAVAMSDPFGEDDIDFDTNGMLTSAYNNAIAMLKDERPVSLSADGDMGNPLVGKAEPAAITNGTAVAVAIATKIPAGWPPGSGPSSKSDVLLSAALRDGWRCPRRAATISGLERVALSRVL